MSKCYFICKMFPLFINHAQRKGHMHIRCKHFYVFLHVYTCVCVSVSVCVCHNGNDINDCVGGSSLPATDIKYPRCIIPNGCYSCYPNWSYSSKSVIDTYTFCSVSLMFVATYPPIFKQSLGKYKGKRTIGDEKGMNYYCPLVTLSRYPNTNMLI